MDKFCRSLSSQKVYKSLFIEHVFRQFIQQRSYIRKKKSNNHTQHTNHTSNTAILNSILSLQDVHQSHFRPYGSPGGFQRLRHLRL